MADLPDPVLYLVLAITGLAAISDIRSYTIPNIFPVLLGVLFIVSIGFMSVGLWGLASHLGAGALGFVIGFAFFMFGLMGGGDVKLFAALCLFMRLGDLAAFSLAVAIAGGIFSAGILLGVWLRRKVAPKDDAPESFSKVKVPYGVGIFTGLVIMALIS